MVGLVGGQPGRSAQQTRQQGNQSDADQGNTTARDELLNTLRLAGRVLLTVTFQKVDLPLGKRIRSPFSSRSYSFLDFAAHAPRSSRGRMVSMM